MVEIGLLACCIVIASKFKTAGQKGAAKYILGIVLSVLGGALTGMAIFAMIASSTGEEAVGAIIVPMLAGYLAAIVFAIAGIRQGNSYLKGIAAAEAAATAQELEELKREVTDLKKAQENQ